MTDTTLSPLPAFKDPSRDPSTIRAATLLRVSKRLDNSTSIDRQDDDGASFIARRGWSYDPHRDVFADVGISGFTGKRRPELERLIERLASYDVIVIWKLDRAFRSLKAFLDFLALLEQMGVGLVSVMDPVDTTTPAGRLLAYILMALAEMESENTRTRITSHLSYLANNGLFTGGRIPFGWQTEIIGHQGTRRLQRLARHPENADVLRWSINEVLKGRSPHAVCGMLNELGVPTGQNGRWTEKTMTDLMRNPLLLGRQLFRGEVVRDHEGVPITPHDDIIDLWTWDRLQAELDRRSTGPRSTNEALLRGLAKCGTCGGSLTGASPEAASKPKSCVGYKCSAKPCTQAALKVRKTDAFVVAAVLEWLSVPENIASCVGLLADERRILSEPNPDRPRIEQLRAAITKIEDDDQLHDLYAGEEGQRRYRKRHQEFTAELDVLLARAAARPLPAGVPDLDRFARGRRAEAVWDELEHVERRTLLGHLLKEVVIKPSTRTSWVGIPWDERFEHHRIEIRWNRAFTAEGSAPAGLSQPVATLAG